MACGQLNWPMRRPEEPSVLARPDEWSFHQESGEHHAARDAVGPRPEMAQGRGVAREVGPRGDLVEEGPRLRLSGQDFMRCIKVIGVFMRKGPNDRQHLGAPGHFGKDLRERDARDAAVDGREVAADALRGVRLGVERIDVAEAAREEDQHHRLGPRDEFLASLLTIGGRAGRHQAGKTDAEQTREADLKEFAANDPIMMAMAKRQGHARPLGPIRNNGSRGRAGLDGPCS